jgi:hypothetical protein
LVTAVVDIFSKVFDGLVAPFGGSAGWALFVLSVLIGIGMLLLFKVSTNQKRLENAKRVLLGHIYEMGLFQENLGVILKIQRDLALANLRYLSVSLPALVVLLIPLVPILFQLESRFAHRPFKANEISLLTVQVAPEQTAQLDEIALEAPDGVAVETWPVRDYEQGTAVWRLRVLEPGRHVLKVTTPGGASCSKELVASGELPRIAPARERGGWLKALMHPAEPPLPADSPIESISLDTPERLTRYAGVLLPDFGFLPRWLVAFCVFSLVFGFALKDVFQVKI